MNILEKMQNYRKENPKDLFTINVLPALKEEITYAQLDEITDAFAQMLINKYTIKKEDVIPIDCADDLSIMIAAFTILKTRAKFAPINSRYPDEEKKNVLNFLDFPFVFDDNLFSILEKEYKNGADQSAYIKKLNTDFSDIDENEFSFLIFSSGTTGVPKAVMLTLKAITTVNPVYLSLGGFGDQKKHFLFPPLYSVGGIMCLFYAVATKSVIVATPAEYKTDIMKCLKIANETKSCSLGCPPQIVKLADKFAPGLDMMFVGAEKVRNAGAKNFRVVDGFGMTEASGGIMYREIFTDTDEQGMRPLPNVEIYILNENMQKVKDGEVGELCVATQCVAVGYYKNPELTAEKFVQNPYSSKNEFKRMYRTGEIAYRKKNGEIVHVGRKDFMINIRGFKVEMPEIEAKVCKLYPIKRICVMDYDIGPEKELFLAFSSDEKIDIEKMRSELAKHMPDYMIPTTIIQVEEFPLSNNIKVNRKEVRRLYIDNLSRDRAEYVAPTNDREKEICEAFSRVLKIEKIGIDDDFVKLGGSSILATYVSAEIKSSDLSPLIIFKLKTPRALAKSATNINRIPNFRSRKYYPITFSEKQIYGEYSVNPNFDTYHAGSAFELSGEGISRSIIEKALQKMIEKVEVLRSGYKNINEDIVRYVKETPNFVLDTQKIHNESEVQDNLERLGYSYNLDKDYLFRFKLLELDDRKFLLLHFHHIIIDGTSLTTFIRELLNIMSGKQISDDINNFKNWSLFLDEKKDELINGDYFWEIISSAKDNLKIAPTLHNSFTKKRSRSNKQHFESTKFAKAKLEKIAMENGLSLYQMIFSLIGIVANMFFASQKSIFGAAVNGRTFANNQNTIGAFVNTVPILIDTEGKQNLGEYFSSVKDSIYKSEENELYPVSELIKHFSSSEDRSLDSLFNIFVNYFEFDAQGTIKSGNFTARSLKAVPNKMDIGMEINIFSQDKNILEIMTAYDNSKYSQFIIRSMSNAL
ncbi:MAG: AMP-binding protein, partial [Bifidobacteriaceae bacterium]|nr:AMP-binding protein [Bifidobacteriaceae bacterium]